MNGRPRALELRLLLRSLMIQSTWNPRTMLGNGFAFALKPALWSRFPSEEEREEAIRRHIEHFNAHPYLSSIGLGAVARLETEGADPLRIRHFKTAVAGPLGALGDRLIWTGWLPALALAAVAALQAGLRPGWTVTAFLVVYNAGHLSLRAWGLKAGFRNGPDVATAIKGADLKGKADRLSWTAALCLGVVLGALAGEGIRGGFLAWVPVGALLFLVGNRARRRGWKPAFSATAALIGVIALAGLVAV